MDESRFDDFFLFEYARLVSTVGLVTGDIDVASDAVDEACARAWERLRRGKEIDSLVAWVRVVALNVARGRFRRRATERRARDRLAAREVAPLASEAAVAIDVQRALAELPRRQREVVVLHYFVDLSIDDIATQLDIASGTVKTSLHRARAALAVALGDTNNEVFDGIC
ncbi:MAG: polymerase sigma-70 factor, subfamily [Actinomycetota bacterium]|nr:polymerase sigma-70 factor, subfamily [Actinomycetota bacterium]